MPERKHPINAKHRRFNERGQRVDLFLYAHAEDFPAGSKGGTLAASLKELLAEVSALDAARAASARKRQQGTQVREKMRTDLRQMVKSTYYTARAIARVCGRRAGLYVEDAKTTLLILPSWRRYSLAKRRLI